MPDLFALQEVPRAQAQWTSDKAGKWTVVSHCHEDMYRGTGIAYQTELWSMMRRKLRGLTRSFPALPAQTHAPWLRALHLQGRLKKTMSVQICCTSYMLWKPRPLRSRISCRAHDGSCTPPPPPLSSPIVDMKADFSLNPSNSILKLSMRVIAVEEDIKKAHDNFKSLLIKKQLSQHPNANCKGVFARAWQSEVAV